MKYKLLGRSGLRVSEICLGAMTFGEEWGVGANKEESEKIYRTFIEAGGNFIDTSNRYTEGTSEKFLGDFIQQSGNREEIVLATKYALVTHERSLNRAGNHRKNMMQSVEGSLKRLQTDYIDVLYLHAWDFTTYSEDVMRALNDLIQQGKVFYIAFSDTPAWIVARANTIAELRGWNQLVALQIEYSLIQRTVERDLIPMANAFEMAVVAWAPIGGGALTGKYLTPNDKPKKLQSNSKRLNEKNQLIAREVVSIAEELNCSPAHVAIKWVMQQHEQNIPIVGARNAAQLEDNLKAALVTLSGDHLIRLDEISKIEMGFPHEFLKGDGVQDILFGGMMGELEIHRKGF
ncbi:MAG: aldo/keto reductase [Chitinophagales bacterium]|nr:aldo/keto reductase [Chitinophagales bacterium]